MVKIQFDSHELQTWLSNVQQKQMPYATARALTDTAQDIKTAAIDSAKKNFTLRNNWVVKGIRINRAEKKDWPNIKAEIGSKDNFMKLQEEGGVKKKNAIPRGARPVKTAITTPAKWPGAMLKKNNAFVGTVRTGKRAVYIRQRKRLKLMYVFQDTVNIKPRWKLKETAEQVGRKVMQGHFMRRIDEALRSAR